MWILRSPLGFVRIVAWIVPWLPVVGCGLSGSTVLELLPVIRTHGGLHLQTEFARPYIVRGTRTLTMDVFRPVGAVHPTPAILLIHGGFWSFGAPSTLHDWAADVAAHGYLAAAIEYRLLGEGGRFPEPVADILAAVAHLRAHASELNVDPARLGLFGVSAGGHLALLAGLPDDITDFLPMGATNEPAAVQAIVAIYAPTDFTVDPRSAAFWQLVLVSSFLGEYAAETSNGWRTASPINYVRADGPAVFILHGDRDPVVPVDQARRFRAALEAAGQPHLYVEAPGVGHFWASHWSSSPAQQYRMDILRFLNEHLESSAP